MTLDELRKLAEKAVQSKCKCSECYGIELSPATKSDREAAEAYRAQEYGHCLVPKPGSKAGVTCHEYDFCGCELEDAFLAGDAHGYARAISEAEEYLTEYRKAYDESLFPPRKLEEFDGTLRTVVAFHMGRFLIDNMLRDLRERRLAQGEGENG